MMKEFIIVVLVGTLALCAVATLMGLLFGFPVMWLWNYLMPELFQLKEITFWQALAMVALTTILFRSPGMGGKK